MFTRFLFLFLLIQISSIAQKIIFPSEINYSRGANPVLGTGVGFSILKYQQNIAIYAYAKIAFSVKDNKIEGIGGIKYFVLDHHSPFDMFIIQDLNLSSSPFTNYQYRPHLATGIGFTTQNLNWIYVTLGDGILYKHPKLSFNYVVTMKQWKKKITQKKQIRCQKF